MPIAPRGVEIDVARLKVRTKAEVDLICEIHVVGAPLRLERPVLQSNAALEVIGGLSTKIEGCRLCIERGDHAHPFVNVRYPEAAGVAAKYRYVSVEALFDADVVGVVGF